MGILDVPGLPRDKRGKLAPSANQDQGSTVLKAFRASIAAAKAGVGACDILTIGDSISEGTGPSIIEKRWASKFRDGLRTKHGVTGGRGYVPAAYAVPAATNLFVLSGGAAVATGTQGLGKRVVTMTAAGHTATLTVPAGHTSAKLFYTGGSGRGQFTYTVDGGSATTVNTAQFGTARDYTTHITGLSTGSSHTIVISWLSTGTVLLTGVMLYNGDETTGIRLWDGAHHGQTSAYFATTTEPWYLTVNTIQPTLAILALGTNDWSIGTPTAAQVKTNLATITAGIRAQCTVAPSIIVMPMYERMATGTPTETWTNYVAAMRDYALEDGDVAIFDLYKRIGTINGSGSNAHGILTGDFTHPTDKGSQMIADALLDFVSYPIPA